MISDCIVSKIAFALFVFVFASSTILGFSGGFGRVNKGPDIVVGGCTQILVKFITSRSNTVQSSPALRSNADALIY